MFLRLWMKFSCLKELYFIKMSMFSVKLLLAISDENVAFFFYFIFKKINMIVIMKLSFRTGDKNFTSKKYFYFI